MAVLPDSYDQAEALAFLGALVEDINTPLSWRVYDDTKRTGLALNFYGPFREVAPQLVAAQKKGCGTFVVVNVTKPNGQTDDSVIAPRALYIDVDGSPIPESWPLPPSLIVQRTPIRWHAYWMLDEGEDIGRFRSAQKRLIAWYGSDPKVHNESRVMRVPGFWHLKDPNKPEMYRVVRHAPNATYTIDQVLAAHPESGIPKRPDPPTPTVAGSEDAPIPDGQRNNTLAEIAGSLRRIGLSQSAIGAALQHINRERCRPPLPPDEVARVAASIARYDFDEADRAEAEGRILPSSSLALRFHADRLRDRLTPPPAVIAGLLPVGGIGAIIAMPGVGKTLLAIELSRCLAAGEAFAGHPVARSRVLYVCPDAPASTERRMLAIAPEIAARIVTITDLPKRLPADSAALRGAIDVANAADPSDPIGVVVFDTWDSARAHASGGYADQDAAAEAILAELRRMAEELRIAVVIVHHSTKQDNAEARGTLVFKARCDWMASVESAGTALMLTSSKVRDGDRGHVGTWQIDTVLVGDTPVPVLVPQDGAAAKEIVSEVRDMAVLRVIVAAVQAGETPTVRGIADACRLGRGSQTTRPLDRLRARGFLEADSLQPTASGVAAANTDDTTYDVHPQRVQRGAGARAGASDAPGCADAGAKVVSDFSNTMHPGARVSEHGQSAPATPLYNKGGAGAGDVSESRPDRRKRIEAKPSDAEDLFADPTPKPKRKGSL